MTSPSATLEGYECLALQSEKVAQRLGSAKTNYTISTEQVG